MLRFRLGMKTKNFFFLLFSVSFFTLTAQRPKAVIINSYDGSISATSMTQLKDLFHENGYSVVILDGDDAEWENVKRHSQNASIFVYSGHGSSHGYSNIGGLCLPTSKNTWHSEVISSYDFEKEITLAPGAIVFFKSVCNGAGSSAGDKKDIGLNEAVRRVSAYSQPFLNMGASAYFASNYDNMPLVFSNLFSGETIEGTFIKLMGYHTELERIGPHALDSESSVGIASNYTPGSVSTYTSTITNSDGSVEVKQKVFESFRGYDWAFAGDPSFTLKK